MEATAAAGAADGTTAAVVRVVARAAIALAAAATRAKIRAAVVVADAARAVRAADVALAAKVADAVLAATAAAKRPMTRAAIAAPPPTADILAIGIVTVIAGTWTVTEIVIVTGTVTATATVMTATAAKAVSAMNLAITTNRTIKACRLLKTAADVTITNPAAAIQTNRTALPARPIGTMRVTAPAAARINRAVEAARPTIDRTRVHQVIGRWATIHKSGATRLALKSNASQDNCHGSLWQV